VSRPPWSGYISTHSEVLLNTMDLSNWDLCLVNSLLFPLPQNVHRVSVSMFRYCFRRPGASHGTTKSTFPGPSFSADCLYWLLSESGFCLRIYSFPQVCAPVSLTFLFLHFPPSIFPCCDPPGFLGLVLWSFPSYSAHDPGASPRRPRTPPPIVLSALSWSALFL